METFADGRTPVPYDQAAFTPWPDRDPDMAQAADDLGRMLGIDRAAQDAWAVESHAKARSAQAVLQREIVALAGVTQDAFTRSLSLKTCARAQPVAGTITAANAAVSADAAGFVILVSDRIAAGLTGAKARVVAGRTLGGRPDMPGTAPIAAAQETMQMAGLKSTNINTAEIMEAYAVQAIACVQGIGLDPARVNIGGGALARGHPIGASGAINAVRLFHTLQTTGGHGLAAIGGGRRDWDSAAVAGLILETAQLRVFVEFRPVGAELVHWGSRISIAQRDPANDGVIVWQAEVGPNKIAVTCQRADARRGQTAPLRGHE